jgi:hypothetical protein
VLAEAAPPVAAAKTAIIVYGKRVGTTLNVCTDMDAKFGNFSQRAPVSITEGISEAYFCDADTPESTVRFLQCLQKYGIGLEVVFGTGLQEASVAPAGTFLRPKSPALLASRTTRRATALETWLTPASPRAYLQQLLSRQKLLLL